MAAPSAAKQRQSSGARNRRVAVPDVLGQVMQAKDGAGDDPKPASSASPVELSGKSIDVPEAREDSASSSSTEDEVSRETLVSVPGARFAEISVDNIHPNRKQPRNVFDEDDMAELVHSIREVGLLQPIVVRPSEEEDGEEFELVMGERRWRAVQAANLPTIPAIIRDTPNTDLLRDALLENLHRSQLNPLEEAAAYQQLMQEFDCTQEELSARIGRSRPQISNTIRLMKLPALVQRRVAAGVLSSGHARALLGLADVAEMEKLAQRVVNEGLSVRATEEIVSMNDGLRRPTRDKKPRATARHERLDYLANSLSDQLDTNVKITLGAKKGRVSIEFGSVEDLNRIMGVISPGAPQ
ncbi:ParB/RepB/Spo0J family partition protein [Arthrobacter sp.]|uniref:ParB/RepB/Spo0J family partition protein n=1 Tax=Arthrobacter sp. TaxID=1667 RepID=UPI003A8F9FC5